VTDDERIRELRTEVARLLADAIVLADEPQAEHEQLQKVLHDAQQTQADLADLALRAQEAHDTEMGGMERALASRDLIGQAKGIIMVTLHCDADHAFRLLVDQSQHENRKVVDIAAEITERVGRRQAS
jgi:AmiR/NasT family two-component response regulator